MCKDFTKYDLSLIKPNDKITLVKFSEFGYPIAIKLKVDRLFLKDYAQYKNCLQVQGKPPRKRKVRAWLIKPNDDFVIYKGFVEIDDGSTSYIDENGTKITNMGFCFNSRSLEVATKNEHETIFGTM